MMLRRTGQVRLFFIRRSFFLMKFQAWLSLLLSDYELDAFTCKVSDVAFEFFFHMLDNQ